MTSLQWRRQDRAIAGYFRPHGPSAKAFSSSCPAAASAATPFIKRLREVMKGKYNVRDKFIVIASVLDAHDADTEIELFKKLKDTRDRVHRQRRDTMRPSFLRCSVTEAG
jgi:hypothetical protein